MSTTRRHCNLFLAICCCLLLASFCLSSTAHAKASGAISIHRSTVLGSTHVGLNLERMSGGRKAMKIKRRIGIGSMAPTCTYNECRGCKYKCRAEQIPVDGNDPINSPYHYKCVCHRT